MACVRSLTLPEARSVGGVCGDVFEEVEERFCHPPRVIIYYEGIYTFVFQKIKTINLIIIINLQIKVEPFVCASDGVV